MAKHLATFTDTINDIEISGFIIMTDKELENFEELATSINWDFSYPIADGELTFLDGEDLLSRIDFREISNEEYKTLKKVFGEGFGTFINEDYLEDIVNDEEDLYEDDDDIDEEDD